MAGTRIAKPRTPYKWLQGPPLGVLLAGGLAVLVAVAPDLLPALNPGNEDSGSARAMGYNALVDKLVVGRGWLEMRSTTSNVYRVEETDLAPNENSTDLPVELRDVWTRFKRQSYLGDDVRDPARWIVSDYDADDSEGEALEIVGIDPSAHQVAGPFSAPDNWRGAVLYRPGSQSIVGLIRRPTHGSPTDPEPEPMPFQAGRRVSTVNLFGPSDLMVAPGWGYVFTAPGCPEQLASVVRVASRVDTVSDALVRLPPHNCAVTVKIAGRVERPQKEEVRYVPIGIGQAITFERVGTNGSIQRETFDYTAKVRSVSTAPGPGQARRRKEGLESFARGVEGLMVDQPASTDVVTTLDPYLQQAAENALNELERKGGRLSDARLPARAAVTIMDANTGEVLAIATRPLPPTESLSFVREGLDDRNHNFTAMPIGSLAKGPLTMAILQKWPVLAGLKIEAKGDFEGVVGVAASFRDTVKSGEMDVNSFLALSSNRFAVGLMLLALSDDPAVPDPDLASTEDCYQIGDREEACRPPYIQTLQRTGPAGPDGYVLRGKTGPDVWGPTLTELFDAPTEFRDGNPYVGAGIWTAPTKPRETSPYGEEGIWTGLAGPDDAPLGGATVYLEMTNLAFNSIIDLRQDYLMSMLGGSRLRWPSIKVAEMFSRMVTRHRVEARLIYSTTPLGSEPIDLKYPAEWNLVLRGLEAVTLSGTANELSETSAVDLKWIQDGPYRMFAKTGTPSLDLPDSAILAQKAIARLARRGCGLTWNPVTNLIVIPTNLRPLCRRIADQAGIATRAGPPEKPNEALKALSDAYSARTDERILANPHDVTDLSADARTTGFGHGIALVIGRYAVGLPDTNGVPNGPPERALTIVVNLESGKAGGPATDLAGNLLRSRAVRDWLERAGPARTTVGLGR